MAREKEEGEEMRKPTSRCCAEATIEAAASAAATGNARRRRHHSTLDSKLEHRPLTKAEMTVSLSSLLLSWLSVAAAAASPASHHQKPASLHQQVRGVSAKPEYESVRQPVAWARRPIALAMVLSCATTSSSAKWRISSARAAGERSGAWERREAPSASLASPSGCTRFRRFRSSADETANRLLRGSC